MIFVTTNSITMGAPYARPGVASTLSTSAWQTIAGALLSPRALYASADEVLVDVLATHSVWQQVSSAIGGTSRVAMPPANHYQPRTELGRRLLALRNAAIADGMEPVPAAQIVAELDEFRG